VHPEALAAGGIGGMQRGALAAKELHVMHAKLVKLKIWANVLLANVCL
jgi:hypothetical protein